MQIRKRTKPFLKACGMWGCGVRCAQVETRRRFPPHLQVLPPLFRPAIAMEGHARVQVLLARVLHAGDCGRGPVGKQAAGVPRAEERGDRQKHGGTRHSRTPMLKHTHTHVHANAHKHTQVNTHTRTHK